MINHNRWINTIPSSNKEPDSKKYDLNYDKWLNTIPKKNNKNTTKKFSIILISFVFGLIFVSVIKNETRKLQKEINTLQKSIDRVEMDFHQATLDHEFITSPENLSHLAKKYLESGFQHYKISQIYLLNDEDLSKNFKIIKKQENTKINHKLLSSKVRLEISKKIENKKESIKKIRKLYSEPGLIPGEIKNKVKKEKNKLKKIFNFPKDAISLESIQRWGVIQVVKVFLGIPIIPGK